MAETRLLVVPWAGGGVSAFRGWTQELPDRTELWGLRLPGHEGRLREPLSTSLLDVAAEAARACSGWALPFAVLGHSLGAWIAYEIIRSLAAFRAPPITGLIVSGMRSPQSAQGGEPVMASLPDAEFLTEVDDRYGGLDPELRDAPEIMEAVLPVLRADIEMLERYSFKSGDPIHVPIHVMTGRGDPVTSDPDSLVGWKDLTTAEVSVDHQEGGHFFVQENEAKYLEEVCRVLGAWQVHPPAPRSTRVGT